MESCWDLIYSRGLTRSRSLEACTWPNRVKRTSETQTSAAISIDKPDFSVTFDRSTKTWNAPWKWASDHSPTELANRVQEYTVPDHIRDVYEEELSMWQCNGWLLLYPEEELGPPKGLIPLIAVVQEHKQKVWLVLDNWELNSFFETFTANTEMCLQRLREWWQQGVNV